MKKTAALAPFCILLLLSTPLAAQQPKPAAPGADPAPVRSANVPPDYVLASGDKLRVEVYKDAQLSQSLQIRPDGKITLPLVGDVLASGRTPVQLRDTIAESLQPYITNPTVTVIVVETAPKTFYVMGEVNSPGPHAITGQVSVIQALAMVGGFKDFADTKNVIIRRQTPTGTVDVTFNYKDAVKRETKPMLIQPGDTIIVK